MGTYEIFKVWRVGGFVLKVWEIVGWYCTDYGCGNGSTERGTLYSFQYIWVARES